MKTYQIVLCVIFIVLTVIGYFFDKKEDEPLKEKVFYYRKPLMSMIIIASFLLCVSSGIVVFSWAYSNEENNYLLNNITDNPEIVDIKPAPEKEITNAKEDETNKEPELNEKIKINFDYLKTINQDTIGWIEIEDTNINYPIVKTTDNDYYLKHSFEKEENGSGWIFADYRNTLKGDDLNLIVYGHNRINGTMFGTLKKALSKSWIDKKESHIIKLVTEDYIYQYQIFSSYTIKKESFYLRTSFKSLDYNEFVSTLLSRSKYDYKTSVSEEDQIITLSTCATGNVKRIVVHGKLISKVKHA